jgi:molecular chaperone GrpE
VTDRNDKDGQSPDQGTAPTTDDEGLSPKGAVPSTASDTTNGPVRNAHGGEAPHTESPDELRRQVAAAEAKADEHLDDLRRLAAEFDNYRKRVARDQQLTAARATEGLVKHLLPILDDLERALEAAEQHEEAKLEEGVALVHRSLADLLRRQGLEEIETDGRFDPHVHEALLAQPSDAEEGSVIQVSQKGYRLGDLVLRPARVIVSAGSQGSEEASG